MYKILSVPYPNFRPSSPNLQDRASLPDLLLLWLLARSISLHIPFSRLLFICSGLNPFLTSFLTGEQCKFQIVATPSFKEIVSILHVQTLELCCPTNLTCFRHQHELLLAMKMYLQFGDPLFAFFYRRAETINSVNIC